MTPITLAVCFVGFLFALESHVELNELESKDSALSLHITTLCLFCLKHAVMRSFFFKRVYRVWKSKGRWYLSCSYGARGRKKKKKKRDLKGKKRRKKSKALIGFAWRQNKRRRVVTNRRFSKTSDTREIGLQRGVGRSDWSGEWWWHAWKESPASAVTLTFSDSFRTDELKRFSVF